MSDQTKCCCEVAAMIADVYERLLKAEEWNCYQNEKHTECADRLVEAQDHIRELRAALRGMLTCYGMDRQKGEVSDAVHRAAEEALGDE